MDNVVFGEVIGTVQREPSDGARAPAAASPALATPDLEPIRRYLDRVAQLEARLRAD